jgi:hypothetical protein
MSVWKEKSRLSKSVWSVRQESTKWLLKLLALQKKQDCTKKN